MARVRSIPAGLLGWRTPKPGCNLETKRSVHAERRPGVLKEFTRLRTEPNQITIQEVDEPHRANQP